MSVNFHNLKKYRTLLGFTQLQIANALGIDRSTYSYYELGKHVPDIRTIQKLMSIFKVDYKDILVNEDDDSLLLSDFSHDLQSSENFPHNFKKTDTKNLITTLSDDERQLILAYRALTAKFKYKLLKESLHLARSCRD